MTKFEKELSALAQQINKQGHLLRTLEVNRRNRYYAVDAYSREDGRYVSYYYIGDFKETKAYLIGLLDASWFQKPF